MEVSLLPGSSVYTFVGIVEPVPGEGSRSRKIINRGCKIEEEFDKEKNQEKNQETLQKADYVFVDPFHNCPGLGYRCTRKGKHFTGGR
jgi:hypothetical protein